MQTSILGIGYAYDSHLSYLDHLRIADAAREAGVVAGEAADRGTARRSRNRRGGLPSHQRSE